MLGFMCYFVLFFLYLVPLLMLVLFTVLGRLELQMGGYNDVYEMQ